MTKQQPSLYLALSSESQSAARFSHAVSVDGFHVKFIIRVALEPLEDVRTANLGDRLVLVVIRGDRAIMDVIMQNGIPQCSRRGPVQNREFRFDVGDVYASGSAGNDSVALEEAVGVVAHVTEASENHHVHLH